MKKLEFYQLVGELRKHRYEVTFDVKNGVGTLTAKWRNAHYEVDFPNIADEFTFCSNPFGDGAVYIYSNDAYVICVDSKDRLVDGRLVTDVLWVGCKHTGCVWDVLKRKTIYGGDEITKKEE